MREGALHDRLAQRLKIAREAAGVSQRSMAAKLGTNQTQISFIESGKQSLRLVEIVAWCDALHLDTLDLLTDVLSGD